MDLKSPIRLSLKLSIHELYLQKSTTLPKQLLSRVIDLLDHLKRILSYFFAFDECLVTVQSKISKYFVVFLTLSQHLEFT